MSERSGYMAELDQWTTDTVLRPINRAWQQIASAQSEGIAIARCTPWLKSRAR
jgi:hypothetical protein